MSLTLPSPTIGITWWGGRPRPQPAPGRLLNDRRCLILRGKSGTRASRADQGVRPTINAESHLSGNVSDIGLKPAPPRLTDRKYPSCAPSYIAII